jgi:hypothetical protein
MNLTTEELEHSIRARIVVMDALIGKRDFEGVRELAEECLTLERRRLLLESMEKDVSVKRRTLND